MSDFTATFSTDLTFSRTNIVYDPAFTYRTTRSNGITPKFVGGSTGSGWDGTRSKFGAWSYRTKPDTDYAGIWFERDTTSFLLYATTPQTSYDWSAWVYVDDDCDVVLYIEYYQDDDGDIFVDFDESSAFSLTGGEWTRLTFTDWPPVNGNYAWVSVYKQPSATPIGMNVDGVVYEETPDYTPPFHYLFKHPFFDGDIVPTYPPSNATITVDWDGTPGESTSTMDYTTTEFSGDILSLDISAGRRTIQDFTSPGSCTLELLNPTTVPDIGCPIEVFYGTSCLFSGNVADTEMIYSMTGDTDVLRVSCESYLAKAGRAEITTGSTSGASASGLVLWRCDLEELNATYEWWSGLATYVAYDAFQGNLLTWLQRINTTGFSTLSDARDYLSLVEGDYPFQDQRGGGFTDDLPVTTEIVYSGLRFGANADHYVEKVRIEPNRTGVDPAEAGDGSRSLVVSSFNVSASQTQALADTYLAAFANGQYAPHEVTIDVAAQSNDSWADIVDLDDGAWAAWPPGFANQRQSVTFRGTTYETIVQGFALTATPDSARVTYYLEPITAYPYLRLDDPDVGLLDSNVLAP